MLIGARTAAWGGGWKNPYVTDGLVGMWDGEWNSGGGVHKSTPTEIKDLAGGVGDLVVFGNPTFNSDSIFFNEGDWLENNDIDIQFGNNYTIECVSTVESESTHSFTVYCFNDENGYQVMAYTWGAFVFYFNKGQPTIVFPHPTYEGLETRTQKLGGGRAWSYENGVMKQSANYTGTAFTAKSMSVHGYGQKKGSCLWKTLRFYDRSLSVDEILSNYAIDKARFNLP